MMVALGSALVLIGAGGKELLAADGILYVDAAATTGDNDGSSWDNAYTDLQDALADAGAGDEIWVAEGTYKPTDGEDRTISFQMKNEVAIYGGFAGTETSLEERDWEGNPTILSGDIGTEDDPSDNSYHVFYHNWDIYLDSTAVLDGFTVTGGNANGDRFPDHSGGGMYNNRASPMLSNCTFANNLALVNGGGMLNFPSSSPTLNNCTFANNSAIEFGGGLYNNDSSSPILTNCIFAGNSSDRFAGGGIYNGNSSSPTLTNCIFSGNSADVSGGAMYNYQSSPALTNCSFYGNTAGQGGAILNYVASSPTLTNCILWGDSPDEISNSSSTPEISYSDIQGGCSADRLNSCGDGNIEQDPLFVDPENGDYHLLPSSPCIDVGTNDAPDLPAYDFEGHARMIDSDGDGQPIVDMGADEVLLRLYLPVVLSGY
jgi:hypothetical protein